MTRPWQWPQTVRFAQMFADLAVLSGALYLGFALRFEGEVSTQDLIGFASSLPCVLLIQYMCLVGWMVPVASWRFVSLIEVRRISFALAVAGALLFAIVTAADLLWDLPTISRTMPPRSVIFLDLLLGLVGLISLRVAASAWLERVERRQRGTAYVATVPTLLIGAGCAGAEAVLQIAADPKLDLIPVGFLDDDPRKRGLVIHGIRVLGTVAEVDKVALATGAQQALITIGNPSPEVVRRVVDLCKKCDIPTKVIPGIRHILEGKVNLSAIREVALEDLLHREPIQLDVESIAAFVNGRRLLITGAGGSIGSELCRIVRRYEPASLVLVDNTENNLFHIHRELMADPDGAEVIPCLADICDRVRMKQIFAGYRPDMVLHAAAYKHVPMIEWNPGEAIKNNIVGTRTIADLAHEHGVSEFVMISTDKAVNPTSIMGVTKRIAEIYIQALCQRSRTRFVAVRFGNVLGSAGSVIPTFQEQIARGGPVTVTHPEMKRYFMTIPEACQLVLQAATMGRGGEIFILDMGQPVKIVDLARNLIGLSGFRPGDIEIRYIGMRPGEKLFEELALKDEIANKTRHPKIFIGQLKPADWLEINHAVDDLHELAHGINPDAMLCKLKEIVPEFAGTALKSLRTTTHTGCTREQDAAEPKENGRSAANGSKTGKNGSTPLNAANRPEPLPEHDPIVISVRAQGGGEIELTEKEGPRL
jgi:FlaA1/EpsC-like NDP-sugar epimerase